MKVGKVELRESGTASSVGQKILMVAGSPSEDGSVAYRLSLIKVLH